MYDKVRVYFEDGTDTIIFVNEDDNIQDVLAELADETGVSVIDYTIQDTVTVSRGVYYDPGA